MDVKVIGKLNELLNDGKEVALVTVTEKTGSGPRGEGSMMIVDSEGLLLAGTIGGGAIEGQAKLDAAKCLQEGLCKSFHYELTMEEESLGMACGGTVDVFVKVFEIGDPLVIVGGGHVGSALSKMAKQVGYHVTVIDDRELYGSKERMPWVDAAFSGDIVSFLKEKKYKKTTSIVIVSHGHLLDLDALEACIDKEVRYIGMIGSIKKNKFIFNQLIDKGVSKELLKKVYGPIGLDIGGETPEEIAVSILSEIQAVKYEKEGPFIRDKFNLIE